MPDYNGLQLQYGIQPVNSRPVDYYLGPYVGATLENGITQANSQIPIGIRYESQKVHILVGDDRTPYVCWYFGGTADEDLKLYQTGSDLRVLSNGGFSADKVETLSFYLDETNKNLIFRASGQGTTAEFNISSPFSSKYHYGVSAPDPNTTPINLGDRWYNPEVGTEFVWIPNIPETNFLGNVTIETSFSVGTTNGLYSPSGQPLEFKTIGNPDATGNGFDENWPGATFNDPVGTYFLSLTSAAESSFPEAVSGDYLMSSMYSTNGFEYLLLLKKNDDSWDVLPFGHTFPNGENLDTKTLYFAENTSKIYYGNLSVSLPTGFGTQNFIAFQDIGIGGQTAYLNLNSSSVSIVRNSENYLIEKNRFEEYLDGNYSINEFTPSIGGVWAMLSIQGPQGDIGNQGEKGDQGPTGPTGPGVEGETYTGIQRNSYNTLGTDFGNARKFLVVLEDGSITQDFIKNYEIFKPTDFTFTISSFSFNGNSSPLNVLMGPTGTDYQSGKEGLFTMAYNGTVEEGKITFNSSNVGSATPSVCELVSPFTTDTCTYDIKYPNSLVQSSSNTTYQFTLNVTGSYEGGQSVNRTSNYEIRFLNKYYIGQTSGSFFSSPFDSSVFQNFTGVLSNNKNVPIQIDCRDTQNFGYFAYPSRLGESLFVGSDDSEVVWLKFTHDITNSNGFSEEFLVYQSYQPGQLHVFSVQNA